MRYLVFIAILLSSNVVLGDYEYRIDGCYKFVSCNSIDTCISRHNDTVVFSPMGYSGIGPVRFYAQTVDHLLLRTVGREDLADNRYERPIEKEQWYFAIDISTDSVEGPISPSAFNADPRFMKKLNWKSAAHPLRYLYLSFFLAAGMLTLAVPIGLMRKARQKARGSI